MSISTELLKVKAGNDADHCEYLDLSKLHISHIENLDDFKNLIALNLHDNNISFVDNLHHCSNLWHIDLSDNHVERLEGFERFLALGKLDLSGNNISWSELTHLQHMAVMDLILCHNKPLEKQSYYRIHVIDSLPHVWMLDGQLVTSVERLKVDRFFQDSELTTHPVRHKLAKKKFQTSKMRERNIHGTFGRKALDMLMKFPVHLDVNQDTDIRRLRYLCSSLQDDLLLESNRCSKPYAITIHCPCFIEQLLEVAQTDHITFQVITLLLAGSLLFAIPNTLIQEFLSHSEVEILSKKFLSDVFLLPDHARRSLLCFLVSVIKFNRDHGQDDGLHDILYLSFFYCAMELSCHCKKLDKNTSALQTASCIIANEVAQLLCVCPSFFLALGRDRGITHLVAMTSSNDVVHNIVELFKKKDLVDHTQLESQCHLAADLLLSELHCKACQFYTTSIAAINNDQLHVLQTRDGLPKKPLLRPIYAAQFQTQGLSSPRDGHRDVALAKPQLGDRILFGAQLIGKVIAIPEPEVVLVQTLRVLADNGAVIVNYTALDQHYSYHNINHFVWDCQNSMWRPQGSTGDKITFHFGNKKSAERGTLLCASSKTCNDQRKEALQSLADVFKAAYNVKLSVRNDDSKDLIHDIKQEQRPSDVITDERSRLLVVRNSSSIEHKPTSRLG